MSDPRLIPDPTNVTRNEPAQICVPFANLCRTPGGARDRQVLFGEHLTVLNVAGGHSYVQLARDGYVGYLASADHSTQRVATHRVKAAATHVYSKPDIKSPERYSLSFGSLITADGRDGVFIRTGSGYIPATHLEMADSVSADPARIAEIFLGTPYLWGGNTQWGIDCSGLVQAALLACGIPCPGDSDQQISLGVDAAAPYQRDDLLFWKGHVALVVDGENMIHANAHAMAVTYERIDNAIHRIKEAGDGPVIAHRRL